MKSMDVNVPVSYNKNGYTKSLPKPKIEEAV